MRLMTWNCQVGGFRRKGARAAALRPTVLVVPESENIDGEMVLAGDVQPTTRMWLGGTTTKRGVGVLSYTGAAIHKARRIGDPIDFFVPLEVSADGVEFQVVAVWTAATTDRATRYRQADEGLDRYADWIRRRGTVVMGDFNNNASYAPGKKAWRELEDRLRPLGLVSAYHERFKEGFGAESRPTHYTHRTRERPFHLDYCFVPASWASRIEKVTVGKYDEWSDVSDHMPVIVDVSAGG